MKPLFVCSKFAAVAFALTVSSQALAISNIEDQRPGPPEQGFSGTVELSLAGKTGDSEEKDYAAATKLNYRRLDDVFLLIGSSEYGSTRDIKDTDESFVHLRWMHLFSDTFASEAFTQWEENEFTNLNSRVLAGGGARFTVASKEDTYSLALGIGGFREIEKLDLQTYVQETKVWRLNTYYSYTHALNERTTIGSTTYIQPDVDNFDDVRALFTCFLAVKMTDSLALKFSYQAKYDSLPAKNLEAEPPINKEKTNTEYTTSLQYIF